METFNEFQNTNHQEFHSMDVSNKSGDTSHIRPNDNIIYETNNHVTTMPMLNQRDREIKQQVEEVECQEKSVTKDERNNTMKALSNLSEMDIAQLLCGLHGRGKVKSTSGKRKVNSKKSRTKTTKKIKTKKPNKSTKKSTKNKTKSGKQKPKKRGRK
jgi:hypothetical protein